MKKSFLNWNKDSVDDNVIFKHLFEMSGGEINLAAKDEDLLDSKSLIHRTIGRRDHSTNPRRNNNKRHYKSNNRNHKRSR